MKTRTQAPLPRRRERGRRGRRGGPALQTAGRVAQLGPPPTAAAHRPCARVRRGCGRWGGGGRKGCGGWCYRGSVCSQLWFPPLFRRPSGRASEGHSAAEQHTRASLGHRQEARSVCCSKSVKTAQPLSGIIHRTWEPVLLRTPDPVRHLTLFRSVPEALGDVTSCDLVCGLQKH